LYFDESTSILVLGSMAPLEMSVGLAKGHKTTKNSQKPKPARRKGVSNLNHLLNVVI